MRGFFQNPLRTVKPFPDRLHLFGNRLAAFLVLCLLLWEFRAANVVTDTVSFFFQIGQLCFAPVQIGLQVGNRVNAVLPQKTVVRYHLFHIPFRRPQIYPAAAAKRVSEYFRVCENRCKRIGSRKDAAETAPV